MCRVMHKCSREWPKLQFSQSAEAKHLALERFCIGRLTKSKLFMINPTLGFLGLGLPDTSIRLNHLNIIEMVESEICRVIFKCLWKIDLQWYRLFSNWNEALSVKSPQNVMTNCHYILMFFVHRIVTNTNSHTKWVIDVNQSSIFGLNLLKVTCSRFLWYLNRSYFILKPFKFCTFCTTLFFCIFLSMLTVYHIGK